MTAAQEYRQIASMLRAKAASGGGIVQYTFNGKTIRCESIKDLLEAAKACDEQAAILEGYGRAALAPSRLVYRRG